MGNVRKSLDAGFDTVLLVVQEATKLAVLKNAVLADFPEAANIHCILPSFVGDFLRMATGVSSQNPPAGSESQSEPKRSVKESNPGLANKIKAAALQKISEAMRRPG